MAYTTLAWSVQRTLILRPYVLMILTSYHIKAVELVQLIMWGPYHAMKCYRVVFNNLGCGHVHTYTLNTHMRMRTYK